MTSSRAAGDPTKLQGIGVGALNVGNLLDTVEFVKNAWSSFGVPSSLAPTTDVDELDRRIADLKAVEQWLTMNLNLLKASVQALEIQRGTIATLKAYGAMLGSPSQGIPGAQALAQAMAAAASSAMSTATTSAPVSGSESIPATATLESAAHAAQTPAAEMAAAASGEAPPATAPTTPGLDAAAWWDLLHRQFNQITAAALGAGGESAATRGEPRNGTSAARATREGAPVARSRKTPSNATTRKTSGSGESEPGRRGRRPDR